MGITKWGKDEVRFEGEVRNESGHNGNILSCHLMKLTWDDVKNLPCSICGREIKEGEWSHIVASSQEGIKRYCPDH